MKRRSILSLPAVALAPMLAGGCSVLPLAAVEEAPTLHVLDARPTLSAGTRRELVLAVSAPRAAPGYDTPAMVYVQRPHALEHFATHRWADTPARLLQPLLVRTLDDAGIFRAVIATGSGVQADLRLDTEIVQLRQNFLVRPSRAELSLRVVLVETTSRRVLAARNIEIRHASLTDDAPGGVAACNAAVGLALSQLVAWCAQV